MINTSTFKISAFALFLLTTACAYSGEALVVPLLHNNNGENHDHDLENPAVIQLNNHDEDEAEEVREERLKSARRAFACGGLNILTAAFQYYTLSTCNEVCNKPFKTAFDVFLLTGTFITGFKGLYPSLDLMLLDDTSPYRRSTLRTKALSALSLCASFSCGFAALNNPNHFAVINGSGVAATFGTGLYLLRKGFKQSHERPPRTNVIEDLLEPEAQV